MIVKRSMLAVLCMIIGASLLWAGPPEKKEEDAAHEAVLKWLALMDAREYLQCWKESGAVFRNHLSEEQWIHMMDMKRAGFGAVVSRDLKQRGARTMLRGAPEGEYVVFRFETSFLNRKALMREIIAVMKEEDGKWRVACYYVR